MNLRKREMRPYDHLPRWNIAPEDTPQWHILTSLAQVTALQLGASRTLISLCDCEFQYVLAETHRGMLLDVLEYMAIPPLISQKTNSYGSSKRGRVP
ncbi:hypothetical protein ASPFODRAFT_53635 [Aspergillus luchuensis CBS 106.47]|uniref:Uncharacterized protein n=1 Tax=Aspergillus luchuensis (strain CBS 106.47) TaxID=1137211 RepID=A0A1M3T0K5_ASPLC|nr:hypothetical protein ASPFODRAFT_53635 [Aspergillus luchuensis CBS 106.47]